MESVLGPHFKGNLKRCDKVCSKACQNAFEMHADATYNAVFNTLINNRKYYTTIGIPPDLENNLEQVMLCAGKTNAYFLRTINLVGYLKQIENSIQQLPQPNFKSAKAFMKSILGPHYKSDGGENERVIDEEELLNINAEFTYKIIFEDFSMNTIDSSKENIYYLNENLHNVMRCTGNASDTFISLINLINPLKPELQECDEASWSEEKGVTLHLAQATLPIDVQQKQKKCNPRFFTFSENHIQISQGILKKDFKEKSNRSPRFNSEWDPCDIQFVDV
ncbi:MAG: hypothetical protein H0X29_02305 [Parachlamydiaceae bacterium]|nr:hypothetical protein [Parachlamydiaceae bacterium]